MVNGIYPFEEDVGCARLLFAITGCFLSEGGTEDERKHEDRPLGGKAAKVGDPQTIQLRSTAEDPPPDLEAAAATKLKQREGSSGTSFGASKRCSFSSSCK